MVEVLAVSSSRPCCLCLAFSQSLYLLSSNLEGMVAESIGAVEVVAGASLYHHHILVCMSLASFSYAPLNH